jgi:hypothetical protein
MKKEKRMDTNKEKRKDITMDMRKEMKRVSMRGFEKDPIMDCLLG